MSCTYPVVHHEWQGPCTGHVMASMGQSPNGWISGRWWAGGVRASCRAVPGSQPCTGSAEVGGCAKEHCTLCLRRCLFYSLGFQTRTVFRHLPAALLLETYPCTNLDTSRCIHQVGDRNNPPQPMCPARKHAV